MYIDEDGNEYEMPKAEVCRRWVVLESLIGQLDMVLQEKRLEQYNLVFNLFGEKMVRKHQNDFTKIAKKADGDVYNMPFRRELLKMLDERTEIFLKDFD